MADCSDYNVSHRRVWGGKRGRDGRHVTPLCSEE